MALGGQKIPTGLRLRYEVPKPSVLTTLIFSWEQEAAKRYENVQVITAHMSEAFGIKPLLFAPGPSNVIQRNASLQDDHPLPP